MTIALIPAAGTSSRMGRPKLALPLGDRTVLEMVVHAFRQAGVGKILVVVGPSVPELVPLAESAGAAVLRLGKQTSEMRATVEQGLDWLEDRYHPEGRDNWILAPADHPSLNPAVVAELLRTYAGNPQTSIVVPTFHGQRGHPALLSWEHAAQIKQFPANQGLNVYLRQHASATIEMPVEMPDILVDLDTPEDYQRLQARWMPPTLT
ncbi:MAG TPA: nucleotidyltransferase family protein [Gemmataceae bacterium]|nr:nucleotidyltransferase family protein [Gemmataceae bacterium]